MEKLVIGLAVAAALMGARVMTQPAVSNPPERRADQTATASTTTEPVRAVQDSAERPADTTATTSNTMAPPTLQDAVERRAEVAATALNAMAPLPLGGQGMLTGAKADGRTIELDIQLSQGIPANIPEDAFDRGLVAVTCIQKNIGDLLGQGGAVRYAIVTLDGRALNPVTVSSCPTAG